MTYEEYARTVLGVFGHDPEQCPHALAQIAALFREAGHKAALLARQFVGGNTIISAETDGDSEIDFQLEIVGEHDLASAIVWL